MSENSRLGFGPFLDGYYDAQLNLQMQVYRRSEEQFARWERHKDALKTPEEIRAWQSHIREVALRALGGLPVGGTPLEPEVVGSVQGRGFTVERVIFQSLPGVYVTSNLYIPDGLDGPTPAVLFLCGHSEEAKSYPVYQAVCQRLARNGMIVLAMDPLGQGERMSYLDAAGRQIIRYGTAEHSYAGLQCWWLGQSIARYFVHDAIRAVDYLATRPEVDPNRIAVTGNSGGGTQATWLMMLEPRLVAAAPATFVTRRREYLWSGQAQDAEQIIVGGTAAGLDHEDFLIAMAPRPTLVMSVNYDYFCLEGTFATLERAKRVFRLFGAESNLAFARADSTHAYHPGIAKAATAFLAQRLLGTDPREVDHSEPEPFEPSQLNCTPSGQVLLDRPEVRRVFDLNLDEYCSMKKQAQANPPSAEEARDWLGTAVRRNRRTCDLNPRWLPGPTVEGATVLRGLWWSETDCLNAGVLLRPTGHYDSLLIALFDRGTGELEERREWLLGRVAAGQAVLALDVRGTGELTPRALNPRPLGEHYGTLFKLNCDLLCLDDSLAAGRVFDVLRAVDLAQEDGEIGLGGRPVHLYGAGLGAYHGYLAAALDERLASVEVVDSPVDPEQLLTTRLYEPAQQTECLLPGLAARFSLADFRPLLRDRLVP